MVRLVLGQLDVRLARKGLNTFRKTPKQGNFTTPKAPVTPSIFDHLASAVSEKAELGVQGQGEMLNVGV